eukprot:4166746-Pyramimonas_sp.AAC.1
MGGSGRTSDMTRAHLACPTLRPGLSPYRGLLGEKLHRKRTSAACPPRRRASDPNIKKHPSCTLSFPGQRPARSVCYETSRHAHRPCEGDAHT